jgi:hypothetical protein
VKTQKNNHSPDVSGLTHIRTASPHVDVTRFPDFFCIGPQRTGSTWLHSNLVKHPEILLHRDKETFYFSTLGHPSSPRFRYRYLEDYLASFRNTPWENLLKNYHSLRRCGCLHGSRILGESTASYCVLSDEVLAEIVSLNPELKAILLLRNPLERAWSHAKKDLVRDANRAATPEEFLAFCATPEQIARADYAGIIARWRNHLKPGHFLVAPASRIQSQPDSLLADVLAFLGAKNLKAASRRHVTSRQNPTADLQIPPSIRNDLEKLLAVHSDSYQRLIQQVGDVMIF